MLIPDVDGFKQGGGSNVSRFKSTVPQEAGDCLPEAGPECNL